MSEPSPRRRLDSALIFFANLFLVSYLVDGIISLLDVALGYGYDIQVLGGIRGVVANAVIWMSVVWLPLVLFVTRLPRFVLFFLAFSVYWLNNGAPPINLFFDEVDATLQFVMCALQVAIGLVAILNLKARHGAFHLNQDMLFPGPWRFSRFAAHVSGQGVVALLLGVVMGAMIGTFSATAATSGFIVFRSDGIYVRDIEFQSPTGRSVRLVGMIHLGDADGYRRIFKSFDNPGTLVLAEGVRGNRARTGRMQPYQFRIRSLVSQPVIDDYVDPSRVDIRNADIAIGEFSEETQEAVRALGRSLGRVGREEDLLVKLYEMLQLDVSDADYDEIINLRNERLLEHLWREVDNYAEVVVPWGAMHQFGIARALYAADYEPVRFAEHRLISWKRFLNPLPTVELFEPLPVSYSDEELALILARLMDEVERNSKQGILLQPIPAMLESSAEPSSSFMGGLPTRYEGEEWPHNEETGKPMRFVAEIVRDEIIADHMGVLERVRLFVDYDRFGEQTGAPTTQVMLTRVDDPPIREIPWEVEEIETLKAAFGEDVFLGFPAIKVELRPEMAKFIPSAVQAALEPPHADNDSRLRWYELYREKAATVNLQNRDYRNLMGVDPYWITAEETSALPFFLQLSPFGDLTFDNGGMFYLFLDPDAPDAGFELLGQSN